ncbi:MAG TPA: ABC transporter permease [Pseudonocardia sp.]|jgi:putative ABC transport system permease protein
MKLTETLATAMRSLRGNRLRSLLTSLGIIIGVAAVIVLVALGNGLQSQFNAQFSRLANQVTITEASGTVPGGGQARPLTDRDVQALRDQAKAPDIATVMPNTSGSAVLLAGQAQERASVLGVTEDYLDVTDRSVAAGSWFGTGDEQDNAKDAVLGEQAVSLLWGPNANPGQVIGQSVRINSTTFTVVGVLAQDGQNDNVAIVPMSTSRDYLFGNANDNVNQITIKATSADTVNDAMTEATTILDRQHFIKSAADRDYNVHDSQNLLTQRSQMISFLTLFIVAVAAISLLVGGIGVANIMLVAVTERTREIGIRKAIGARRAVILKQFLIEAILLTGLGGSIGVLLGLGLGVGGDALLPSLTSSIPAPILTPLPVLVAFGVSLAIGLVAGVYPAARASRLLPIEALRFE